MSSDDDHSSDPELDNDKSNELSEGQKPSKKIFAVNNKVGLNSKLKEIKLDLSWVETFDIVVDTSLISDIPDAAVGAKNGVQPDVTAENDFKREMAFYNQAKFASEEAIQRLTKLGVPTKRPKDYFAEMAKSDAHMVKVREKLLSKQVAIERSEKARALRDQRKHGKKIQQEVLKKRQSEKKVIMDALKKGKKGKKIDTAALLEERKKNNMLPRKNYNKRPKEQHKDEKYGYGGKKKGSKYNTAESSANINSNKRNAFSKGKKQGFGKKQGKKGRRRR